MQTILQMNKLELNDIRIPEDSPHYCQALISIITGYALDEVVTHCNTERFYTRDFKRVFAELGFQVGARFVKFDPDTTLPGIARVKKIRASKKEKASGSWYPYVYYDGRLYDSFGPSYPLRFLETGYVVTSFLPVYVM